MTPGIGRGIFATALIIVWLAADILKIKDPTLDSVLIAALSSTGLFHAIDSKSQQTKG